MNAKKGLMSVLAVGFVALLMGGFVAALDAGTTLNASVSNVQVADKLVLDKVQPRIIPYGDDVVEGSNRRIALARLASINDVRDVTRERMASLDDTRRVEFRDSVSRVRAAIAEFRKNPSRDDFKGFSFTRLLNASGLSQEDKDGLKEIYQDVKNSDSKKRLSFMLSSPASDFVAVGKFSTVQSEGNLGGTLVGFSNQTNQRFFAVWGNGSILGVSDGKVFWGSYWNDGSDSRVQNQFELHNFADDRVIQGHFFVY
jgi:hypothetical protein